MIQTLRDIVSPQGANDPKAVERARRLAELLADRASDTSPVGHWTQALARMADGLVSGIEERRAASGEAAGREGAAKKIADAISGLSQSEVSPSTSQSGNKPSVGPRMGGAATATGSALPKSLKMTESGGRWNAQNNVMGAGGKAGHFGRAQFGQARLAEAAAAGAIPKGTTPQQFMASPELQIAAENWHFGDIDSKIRENGFDQLIGQKINGVPITMDGMRAVAHLGGTGGLKKFIQTSGRYNPSDKFGTSLLDYLGTHQGDSSGSTQKATRSVQEPSAPPAAPDIVIPAGWGPPNQPGTAGAAMQPAQEGASGVVQRMRQISAPVAPQPMQTAMPGMPVPMTSPDTRNATPLDILMRDQARAGLMQSGGPSLGLGAIMSAPQTMGMPAAPQPSASAPSDPAGVPAQAANSNDKVTRLVQALSDPWLDANQRDTLQTMLQAEMQKADPAYQMQLEQRRLELEQLRNPTKMVQETDERGNLWQIDPRTNERKLLQAAPDAPKPPGLETLSPGQVLVDPSTGQPIYTAPPKPEEKARVLTADEVKQLGLPPGAYQQKPDGTISQIGGSGMYLQTNPDGTVTFQQGAGKMTEAESKDLNWAQRMEAVAPRMDEQEQALNDIASQIGGNVPVFGNYLKSDAYRQAQQTAREWLAPMLRKDTGAAVTPDEMTVYGGIFIPEAGDDAATIEQKRLARAAALDALRLGKSPEAIRRAGIAAAEKAKSQARSEAQAAPQQSPQAPVSPDTPPPGVDPEDWKFMTPEERKLWQR